MRPTPASEVEAVKEANRIVGREGFKIIWEAAVDGNVDLAINAQKFLNGPDYGKRKQLKRREGE